jgi:hypothetical protein
LGFQLKPRREIPPGPIPAPFIDVMATRPDVGAAITQASIYPGGATFDVDVTVPPGHAATLYVEVSGIGYDATGHPPRPDPGYWTVSPQNSGDYSAGTALTVRPGSHSLKYQLSFDDCRCYRISGAYVVATPLALDTLQQMRARTSEGGTTVTKVISDLGGDHPGRPESTTPRASVPSDEAG